MHTVQLLIGNEAISVTIAPGESILIGRAPEQTRVAATRTLSVRLPSISVNHLLLSHTGDKLVVHDLGSKNGSWLRLPANVDMPVDDACVVRMGSVTAVEPREDQPPDSNWNQATDFAGAIAGSVNEWLSQRGIPARAAIGEASARNEPAAVPLADGRALRISFLETIDSESISPLEGVWRYVERQNARLRVEEETRKEGMILASPAIRRAHARVVEAARRGLRLLLIGPSGSGKEGLARCYHRNASGNGSFVARNCSTLRGELLRSELFGAEAGSFTGCVRRIIGAVERAHGGTLFLDEIGDLPEDVQPMLLRFLDSGEFERLGEYGQARTANANIICATNKDLRSAVQRGAFRADLWYRLSIEVVEVPPLRDRPEDVVAYLESKPLADGTPMLGAFDDEARQVLRSHDWAGNFRELANLALRIPFDVRRGEIDRAFCIELLSRGALQTNTPRPPPPVDGDDFWLGVAQRAIAAFVEDYGNSPASWDDIKNYVEKYLKPLLFAQLSGAVSFSSLAEAQPPALAARLDADRGTALKHLTRYFERFGR